jgi:hypothetical protein
MSSYKFLFVILSVIMIAGAVRPGVAEAALNDIFGLSSISINPPSGGANSADVLNAQFGGTSGTTLVPTIVSVSLQGPFVYEFLLANPNQAGATIPTPWNRQTTLGPLAAGTYDFYVRGVIGYQTTNEFELGRELAINDFVVVPEPVSSLLAIPALGACLVGARPKRHE